MKKTFLLCFFAVVTMVNAHAQKFITPPSVFHSDTTRNSLQTPKIPVLDKDGGLSDKMLAPQNKRWKSPRPQLAPQQSVNTAIPDTTNLGDGMYLIKDGNNAILEVKVTASQWANLTSGGFESELVDIDRKIYSKFNDDFDFIFFVLNTPQETNILNNLGFYGVNLSISNTIQGIGAGQFNFNYGSEGKLKSMMYFPYADAILFGPTLHELSHNWAAYILDRYLPDNILVDDWSPGHWGVSSAGGQLGGFKYVRKVEENSGGIQGKTLYQASFSSSETNPDSSFKYPGFGVNANGGNALPYSDIELYLMGMKSAQELRNEDFHIDIYSGNSCEYDGEHSFGDGYFYSTTVTSYSIDDIIEQYGEREPNAAISQKQFNVLTVALTPDDATQSYIADIMQAVNWLAGDVTDMTYPELYNFRRATNNLGLLETNNMHHKYENTPILNNISVSQGTLSPQFNPYVFDYTVYVDENVTNIDVTGTANNATVNGNATAIPLLLNDYTDTTLTVTNTNGISKEYRISIIRGKLPPVTFTYQILDNAAGQAVYTFVGFEEGSIIVDWGDGTERETINERFASFLPAFGMPMKGNSIPHIYTVAGSYQVTIYGDNEELPSPLTGLYPNNTLYQSGFGGHQENIYISSVDVRKATFLNMLNVDNYSLEDYDANSSPYSISHLDVSHNPLLTWLFCGNNNIHELDVSHNSMLKRLECGRNQLTSLDVSHNTGLTDLRSFINPISNIDLSHNAKLREIYIGKNNLKTLDLSENTKLVTLSAERSQLSNLNLTNNVELEWIGIEENPFLASLDVSHNTKLKDLICNNCNINSLNITNNEKLLFLGCGGNQIKTLDVNNNTALTLLDCRQNLLSTLDISNNHNLTDLICCDNQLTTLDISNNQALNGLDCRNNAIPLIDIYAISQRNDITNKTLNLQTLPIQNVDINITIPVDTIFYGINSAFWINGIENTDYTLSDGYITFLKADNYNVTVTNPAIGDGIVTYQFKVTEANGITELSTRGISIFPNPAKDEIFIQSEQTVEKVEILDISGSVVVSTHSTTANVAHLPKGIYFAKIFVGNHPITKKIIKE